MIGGIRAIEFPFTQYRKALVAARAGEEETKSSNQNNFIQG
jgi:hypothetical protein